MLLALARYYSTVITLSNIVLQDKFDVKKRDYSLRLSSAVVKEIMT